MPCLFDRIETLFSLRPAFRDRHGDQRETAMCRGLMCGPGWFDLIDVLASEITRHAEATGLDVVAVQVKEKFGELRCYLNGGDEYVNGLTWIAASMSKTICEECGAPGWMSESESGWIKVRCAEHGGRPQQGERRPMVASFVLGPKGLRAKDDADLFVTKRPPPTPVFRLPEIRTECWKPLAEQLEQSLDLDVRRNGMPMAVIDEVIESESLSFRWHGGDDDGRARAFFRMIEAYSLRIDHETGRLVEVPS